MSYTDRARTPSRRTRIRKSRVAGLLVLVAAITALNVEWQTYSSSRDSLSSKDSSSSAAPPTHAVRSQVPGSPSETGSGASTGRLGLGEADGAVPDGTTVFDDAIPGVAKLNSDLLDAVRRAATDAAGDGVQFYVDSGWRSPEYQGQLLREAISTYGSEAEAKRWVAAPETSAHVKGDAIDIGPTSAAAWLFEHGAAYGLCQIYANEPWHYELRPEAVANGCPDTYPDPTQDPRMRQ